MESMRQGDGKMASDAKDGSHTMANDDDSMTDAEVFGEFMRDRMERADVSMKELHYRTGIPIRTLIHYRYKNARMPSLINGLKMLEAVGSNHAKALLEIWRSWKDKWLKRKRK